MWDLSIDNTGTWYSTQEQGVSLELLLMLSLGGGSVLSILVRRIQYILADYPNEYKRWQN